MANIKQAAIITKGHITTPDRAGETAEHVFTYTFDKAFTAATDILELGIFIPFAKIMDVDVADENIAGVNWTIGFMSGDVGSVDPARTSSNEFWNAQAAGTPNRMTLVAIQGLASNGEVGKSIGVKASADIAAAANKKIHLRVRYKMQ